MIKMIARHFAMGAMTACAAIAFFVNQKALLPILIILGSMALIFYNTDITNRFFKTLSDKQKNIVSRLFSLCGALLIFLTIYIF